MKKLQRFYVLVLALLLIAPVALAAGQKQANPPVITEGDVIAVTMSEDSDPTPFALTLNATDADLNALTWTVASQSSNGVAGVTGNDASAEITYVPSTNFNGTDSFGVQVADGNGGTDLILVNVTVQAVNDPPILAPVGNQTVSEGETLLFGVVATDPDGEANAVSAANLPTGAEFDAGVGVFTWTPDFESAGFYGDIVFSVIDVGDAAITISETISITVLNTNRPPILDAVGNSEIREERTLSFSLSGSDPDGDTITFFMDMLPAGATFDVGTATFTYTPALGDDGDYAVVAGVRDNGAPSQSDTEAFVITVTPLDPSAVFEEDAETLLANFADGDLDDDGLLSLAEAQALVATLLESRFDAMDDDEDGNLSERELLPFATISDTALESAAQALLGAFATADTDEDGLLSNDEATAARRGLTLAQFEALDGDSDGFLSEEEISDVATARAVRSEILAEQLLLVFDASDTDLDETLSRAEATAVIADLSFEDFQELDLDGDELLSEAELTTTATARDANVERAAELILEFFYTADADRDGFVSREEATVGISSLTLRDFQDMDQDGDGLLSKEELAIAAEVGDAELETAAEALQDGFGTADADADGFLSQVEAETVVPGLTLEQFQELDGDGDELLSEAEVESAATLDDPVPLAPQVVEGVSIGGLTPTSALLTWKTQVPSIATLRYGTKANALDASVASPTPGGDHQVALSGLTRATNYFARVDSVHATDDTLTNSSRVFMFRTTDGEDATAPVFTVAPAVTGVSDTAVHLSWTTDEFSFGQVFFDDGTTRHTRETPQAERRSQLIVDGLTAATEYNVTVDVADTSGNQSAVVFTVTTMTEPERAPARFVDGVLITRLTDTAIGLRWATDKPATTEVRFSEDDSLRIAQSLPGLRMDHQITLVGLSPETAYMLEARSTDWLDNGVERIDVPGQSTLTEASAAEPVFMATPRVIGTTDTSATIYWETDQPADTELRFSTIGVREMVRASSVQELAHRIRLTGLSPDTKYRFICASTNLAGARGMAVSTAVPGEIGGSALVFTTDADPDVTAPVITEGPEVVGVNDEGFTVRWVTDELADSFVRYGPVDSTSRQDFQDNTLRLEHIVTLRGLKREMAHEFVVNSADASGNGPTFGAPMMATTTAAIDSTAPQVSVGPTLDAIFSTRAALSWETNELTSAEISVRSSADELDFVLATATLGTDHSTVLPNLLPNTTYAFSLRAVDQSQNSTVTTGQFTTEVAAITASPSRIVIGVGGTRQITAKSEDPNETEFRFLSDNPAIANVSETGLVTGISNGLVNIIVSEPTGQRGVLVSTMVIAIPEEDDLTGFFSLLAILLLQNGDSGTIGPCFIATAAAGTPLSPEIDLLRTFRDEWMLSNGFGTMLVDVYYQVSPPLADWVARSSVAAAVVRILLVPVLLLVALWMQSPVLTIALVSLVGWAIVSRRRRRATA